MGNKSELIQQYNEISAKSNALNAKIAELSEALKNLNNVSTTVDYILKNHENIKNNYNLAGTAYKNETEAEQTTVKILQGNSMLKYYFLALRLLHVERQWIHYLYL